MIKTKIVLIPLLLLLLAGCAATVREGHAFRPSTATVTERENEKLAEEILSEEEMIAYQQIEEIYRAEEYFAYGVHANAGSQWQEAQYHFEKALSILADLDIDPETGSLIAYEYDKLLKEIRTEYKLTLLYLATISGDASSSAFVERFAEIDDFSKLKTAQVTTDVEEKQEYDIPVVINKKVENSIIYFQTVSQDFFQASLCRAGKYLPLMEKILAEERVPHDLVYLPLIESGFKTNAYSWAHAVGPWQFISSTGRLYGLNRNWWYDERRDFEKSTRAAARHLRDLYQQFDDWYLALAAYNGGGGRVTRAIKAQKTKDFWKLGRKLKRETRNYVPLYLAATIIAKNPEKYGFQGNCGEPLSWSTVTIDKCVDLRDVARALGTTYKHLKLLNPELLRKFTPPNRKKYQLRIPTGQEERFWAAYEKLKSPENAVWVRHKIRRGESLSTIARSYRTSIHALADANNLKRPYRIIAGRMLLVPVPDDGSYRKTSSESSRKHEYVASGNKYTVRRGDSLWDIARAFGTTVSSLRSLNGLSRRAKIYPGQTLVLGKSSGKS
ncbi:MAG: LysM peptidoglycan-binding domain-containing protein, partial [candidate division Zixibacteria bacterium]|nr:LysM peptidoglycan-binding domain-containing protein [candidate division Zixibacteria bacterium]